DFPHKTVTPLVVSFPLAHTEPLSNVMILVMSNENDPVWLWPSDLTFVSEAPRSEKTIFAPSPSPVACPSISATGNAHHSGLTLPMYPPLPHTAGWLSSHTQVRSDPPVRKPHSRGTGNVKSSTLTVSVFVILEPSALSPVKTISFSPVVTSNTVSAFR